jgi:hypothetical protein
MPKKKARRKARQGARQESESRMGADKLECRWKCKVGRDESSIGEKKVKEKIVPNVSTCRGPLPSVGPSTLSTPSGRLKVLSSSRVATSSNQCYLGSLSQTMRRELDLGLKGCSREDVLMKAPNP